MGSHYIPVGKLKIDKDLLDIACPAAGYGGTPPPPELYCPSQGYPADPNRYVPPIPLPAEYPEQTITFICNAAINDWRDGTFGYKFEVSTGGRLYELFDAYMTPISSWLASGLYEDFDFPHHDRYYIVRISPKLPDAYITRYFIGSSADYYNSCVEAIIFNAPGMDSINFIKNPNLQHLEFKTAMPQLTAFSSILYGAIKIRAFDFPPRPIANASGAELLFRETALRNMDLSKLSHIEGSLSNILKECKYLSDVKFPDTILATSLYYALADTTRLISCEMYKNSPNMGLGILYCLDFAFMNSGIEGEIRLPGSAHIVQLNGTFQNCANVTKVALTGVWPAITTASSTFYGMPNLETIEMPNVFGSSEISGTPWNTTTKVKYYKGPGVGFVQLPTNTGLVSITGNHDTSAFAQYPYAYVHYNGRLTLTEVQMPLLRVSRLAVSNGSSTAYRMNLLTTIEIDWANSDFSSTSSPQLMINAALDATELNRIMGLLPVVSGKTADFRHCTGYSGCDKTIAEAKGWTVI